MYHTGTEGSVGLTDNLYPEVCESVTPISWSVADRVSRLSSIIIVEMLYVTGVPSGLNTGSCLFTHKQTMLHILAARPVLGKFSINLN